MSRACYRDWTVQAAERLGLTGWVRNLPDGAVEAVATGPADRVEAFIQRCHDGPERARVDAVAVSEAADEGLDRFARR
jgi:acylphosphatase